MKKISDDIAKERLIMFQKTADEIKMNYRKKLFDKKSLVLFENREVNTNNKFFGRDEYSNSVIVKSDKNLTATITEVKILSGNLNTLFGETIPRIAKNDFAA